MTENWHNQNHPRYWKVYLSRLPVREDRMPVEHIHRNLLSLNQARQGRVYNGIQDPAFQNCAVLIEPGGVSVKYLPDEPYITKVVATPDVVQW